MAIKEYAAKLIEQDATLKEIAEQKETLWVNPKFLPFEMTDAVCQLVVSDADIADAEARLERFAPFIRKCFPETECTNGIIESPLKPIPEMQKGLIEATGSPSPAICSSRWTAIWRWQAPSRPAAASMRC